MQRARLRDTRTRRNAALWALAAAVAVSLIAAGHGPHVVGYLPFLLLLACPLRHMLMHGKPDHRGTDRSR